ncbi:pro-resilin-like [Penaeus chinensis]|uniref:pro-resilin-like n=1 Tax=Penaeus chinensis TaxID=139456 RepID=UPI001FB83128|nr:pro-resilin-like [Penaeus chinensis]
MAAGSSTNRIRTRSSFRPAVHFSQLTNTNMKAAVAMVLAWVALASAAPQDGYNYPTPEGQGLLLPGTGSGQQQYASVPAQYSFQWEVNNAASNNFYGHKEQRENDNTQGSYYVQLPDSRRLLVEYFADASGYHPTISFEGEAQFPTGSGQGQGYPQTGPGSAQGPSQSYGLPA